MTGNKILKLLFLNIGIAFLNIMLFSPGLINILSKSSVLSSSIGGTAIFMSLVLFIYGNYKLISIPKENVTIKIRDIKNLEDCLTALRQSYGKKAFDNDITTVIEQTERLIKRKNKINELLLEKYSIIDKYYQRFNDIIFDVEYVFYNKVKSILNKVNAFDQEDYDRITDNIVKSRFSQELIDSKMSIYNEYIGFVKNSMIDNEEIILKLDALLLQIAKFNSLGYGDIDSMNEIKELDELIRNETNISELAQLKQKSKASSKNPTVPDSFNKNSPL
ncbi:UNVERIFIED_CONTAM: hypothetical protein Cloal_1545 [Acetivibrio alkalicellulosi]